MKDCLKCTSIEKPFENSNKSWREKNGLSQGYTHVEGKFLSDQMLKFNSTYVKSVMIPRAKEIDEAIQRIANKAKFENYVACYNALRCQGEQEYDLFMNVILWKDILEPLCERTHSQYGIVAIIRASMVYVNKEIWKAFLEKRAAVIRKDNQKRRDREASAESTLKKKQQTAREQCVGLIGEEFTKKMGITSSRAKSFSCRNFKKFCNL